LGAGLAVSCQAVEPYPAGEWRLAVALAFLDIGPPEPPRSVSALPAEQDPNLERLRRVQDERLALELALRKLEHVLEVVPAA
jgi:hypothetical protein